MNKELKVPVGMVDEHVIWYQPGATLIMSTDADWFNDWSVFAFNALREQYDVTNHATIGNTGIYWESDGRVVSFDEELNEENLLGGLQFMEQALLIGDCPSVLFFQQTTLPTSTECKSKFTEIMELAKRKGVLILFAAHNPYSYIELAKSFPWYIYVAATTDRRVSEKLFNAVPEYLYTHIERRQHVAARYTDGSTMCYTLPV